MLKVSFDPSPLDCEVNVPVAPAYLPFPPTIDPVMLLPTSPPTLSASWPSGTFAVPEHVPLSVRPEGLVARQTAFSSPTALFEESNRGMETENPLPGGVPFRVGFPIGWNCDALSFSVNVSVCVLPVVLSEHPARSNAPTKTDIAIAPPRSVVLIVLPLARLTVIGPIRPWTQDGGEARRQPIGAGLPVPLLLRSPTPQRGGFGLGRGIKWVGA